MNQERTWKDVVADALRQLGGEGSLKEITAIAEKDPKALANSKIKEKVRQVVRSYKIFETETEGSGIYRLADEASLTTVNKVVTTKDITDEIQGKLLYIGRANDYETFAPSDDCTKRKLGGQPLSEFGTIRENLADIPRLDDEERKRMAYIDVLWFAEIKGELRPRFAFEIENTTKVISGLERLNVIPDLFQARLFVVGENEKQENLFSKFLSSPTFKTQADRFGFKYFAEIRELFTVAEMYAQARESNAKAMRQAGLDF
ncbi:MAG TPA: hypothetical protein VM934_02480 [Pyrinomonadaceae bacterium]|jgi:hypothetical protein|nr:hypothetical protein [Pyrinomonadaceae bacterium]